MGHSFVFPNHHSNPQKGYTLLVPAQTLTMIARYLPVDTIRDAKNTHTNRSKGHYSIHLVPGSFQPKGCFSWSLEVALVLNNMVSFIEEHDGSKR
jgi:hypothetical protein